MEETNSIAENWPSSSPFCLQKERPLIFNGTRPSLPMGVFRYTTNASGAIALNPCMVPSNSSRNCGSATKCMPLLRTITDGFHCFTTSIHGASSSLACCVSDKIRFCTNRSVTGRSGNSRVQMCCV